MRDDVFQGFSELAQRLAGISLRPGSEPMVSARVSTRVHELQLRSEREYLELLLKPEAGEETIHFLDAISTGFTSFWRESEHFVDLERNMRQARVSGQRRFRFWSAACSSGEEPYSMAMVLDRAFYDLDIDWKILATDISVQRLAHAMRGIYDEEQVSALEPDLKARYLTPVETDVPGTHYEVSDRLKERVVFRRLNLIETPLPINGPLDAVFCRNVMFYFEPAARQRLVYELQRVLKAGAMLYVGSAETLSQYDSRLRMERPSMFRRVAGGEAAP